MPSKKPRYAVVPLSVIGDRRLSGADRSVLDCLIAFSNSKAQAWPSRVLIAEITNLKPQNVSRSINRLLSLGYISRPENIGGRGNTNTYTIHIPPLEINGLDSDTVLRRQNSLEFDTLYKPIKGLKSDTKRVSNTTTKGLKSDTKQVVTGTYHDVTMNTPPLTPEFASKSVDREKHKKPIEIEPVVNAWNEMASKHGLASIRTISATRKKQASARIRAHGLSNVLDAIESIPNAPFLLGEGARGWRANFDWFIRESSFLKLSEGVYHGESDSERLIRELRELGHTVD